MAEYKIGQLLIAKRDLKIETELTGTQITVPRGSKVIIGPDRLAHHYRDGRCQNISESDVVRGYDAEGLADYLYTMLNSRYDLDLHLEDECDTNKYEFMESIAEHLREIGFV